VIINNDNSTTNNDNSTTNNDNSTTTNNITHIHTHIHINAFGEEDKSHITPAILSHLIRSHSPNTALRHLIRDVHFNSLVPQNMNIFDPSDGHLTSRLKVFDGKFWNLVEKEDAAVQMTNAVSDDLLAHISKNTQSFNPIKTEEYTDELNGGIDYSPGMIEDALATIKEYNYLIKSNNTRSSESELSTNS